MLAGLCRIFILLVKSFLTLEGSRGRNVESSMLLSNGIFAVRAIWLEHLVESGHAVTRLELEHIRADLVDVSGDIVALVQRLAWYPFGNLPVLGVGAADDDLDDDLLGARLGLGRVADLNLGACGLCDQSDEFLSQ